MKEFKIKRLNVKLRYHDFEGDEIPIIFIHGLGCASSMDYPITASMKEISSHRRILVDLLGSGFSDKKENLDYFIKDHVDYLEEFIDHLNIKEMIIFGHSMGGAISIELAKRCEDRLKGLILGEANLDAGGGFFSKKIAAFNEKDYLDSKHKILLDENNWLENGNWVSSLLISLPKAVYQESVSLVRGTSPEWREILYSIMSSKTFIFGEKSLPDPNLDVLKNENINIEVVKNAGHSMAWDNPKGLAIAIKKGIDLAVNKGS